MGTDPQLRDLGKRDGLQVWRVNNFELEVVPAKNHGIFYAGDSYIILSTSKNASRWDVHFWLGKGSSIDEIGVATIKTIEIDQALGGFPVQHREIQDHESSLFLSHFSEGIRYLEGGYESGFNVVEDQFENWTPKLFHCKGKRNVRCTQVACKKESLNLGDVFLLDLGRDLYIWMPPESGRLERIKGMTRAKHIANVERHGHTKVHILDVDWRSDEDFWSHFGGRDVVDSIAKAKDDDENYWKRTTEQVTLWRVSDSTGHMQVKKIAQGMDVRKSLLDTKDAFILDAVEGGIFVWVGRQCTLEERAKALMWGQKYLQQQNLPAWTAVARVLETAEPSSFTQWFGDWDTEKKKGQFKPRLYQVSDESGKLVVDEIVNFNQESLDGDDVMIMDAKNIIYVWIGANANERERDEAEKTAQDYLKQGSLPRGSTCVELLHQGKENSTFKKLFKKWDDNLFKNQSRSVENMRKLLFH